MVASSDWLELSVTFYLLQPGHAVRSGQHDVGLKRSDGPVSGKPVSYNTCVAECAAKSCIRDWKSRFIMESLRHILNE